MLMNGRLLIVIIFVCKTICAAEAKTIKYKLQKTLLMGRKGDTRNFASNQICLITVYSTVIRKGQLMTGKWVAWVNEVNYCSLMVDLLTKDVGLS